MVLPCKSLYKTQFKTSMLIIFRKVMLIGDTQIKNRKGFRKIQENRSTIAT